MPPFPPQVDGTLPSIDDITVDQVDKLIAKQMSELTVAERDEVLEEVHGVSPVRDEPPQRLAAGLGEMRYWMEELAEPDSGYINARTMDADYVTSPSLLLPFLQASRFDAKEAAERVMVHFHFKKMLFGTSSLARDITMDDISEEELGFVNNGYMRKLPCADRSGRTVFTERLSDYPSIPWKQILRTIWCEAMADANNPNIQRRGIVGITYCSERSEQSMNDEMLHQSGSMMYALPFRIMAYHIVLQDRKSYEYFQKARYFMDEASRLRIRLHCGSDLDNRRSLRSFGLPVTSFEMPCTAELQLAEHSGRNQLMDLLYADILNRKRRLTEVSTPEISNRSEEVVTRALPESYTGPPSESTSPTHPENEPNIANVTAQAPTYRDVLPSDVLCGRGKRANHHPGNARMHELAKEFRLNYEHASKLGKTEVAKQIVRMIQEEGGRFLKPITETEWMELDDTSAREKVGKVLRRQKS